MLKKSKLFVVTAIATLSMSFTSLAWTLPTFLQTPQPAPKCNFPKPYTPTNPDGTPSDRWKKRDKDIPLPHDNPTKTDKNDAKKYSCECSKIRIYVDFLALNGDRYEVKYSKFNDSPSALSFMDDSIVTVHSMYAYSIVPLPIGYRATSVSIDENSKTITAKVVRKKVTKEEEAQVGQIPSYGRGVYWDYSETPGKKISFPPDQFWVSANTDKPAKK